MTDEQSEAGNEPLMAGNGRRIRQPSPVSGVIRSPGTGDEPFPVERGDTIRQPAGTARSFGSFSQTTGPLRVSYGTGCGPTPRAARWLAHATPRSTRSGAVWHGGARRLQEVPGSLVARKLAERRADSGAARCRCAVRLGQPGHTRPRPRWRRPHLSRYPRHAGHLRPAGVRLPGPRRSLRSTDVTEAAGIIAGVADRPVTHNDIERGVWIDGAIAAGAVPAGYGVILDWLTGMIASGHGSRPNDDVLRVTGSPPASFASFAHRNAHAWAVPVAHR